MGVVGGPDPIVDDGLVFAVDPANKRSYISGSSNVNDMMSSIVGTANGVTFSANNVGEWNFDGVDDYIDCTNFTTAQSQFSISVWANASAYGSFNCIASQWRRSNTSNSSWVLESVGTGMYMYVDKNGGGSAVGAGGNTTISTGVWYNFTSTWDGSTTRVYINGAAESTTITGMTSIGESTVGMIIGGLYNSGGSGIDSAGLWNGKISSLLMHNRALSSAEVLQNYNALKDRFV